MSVKGGEGVYGIVVGQGLYEEAWTLGFLGGRIYDFW